jgi:hypothetical protein
LEAVEEKIQELSAEEVRELRVWLAEYDALSGRLDALADQALADFAHGRFTEL